jgi:hypothetical protein
MDILNVFIIIVTILLAEGNRSHSYLTNDIHKNLWIIINENIEI